jgi:hypothetical protein
MLPKIVQSVRRRNSRGQALRTTVLSATDVSDCRRVRFRDPACIAMHAKKTRLGVHDTISPSKNPCSAVIAPTHFPPPRNLTLTPNAIAFQNEAHRKLAGRFGLSKYRLCWPIPCPTAPAWPPLSGTVTHHSAEAHRACNGGSTAAVLRRAYEATGRCRASGLTGLGPAVSIEAAQLTWLADAWLVRE